MRCAVQGKSRIRFGYWMPVFGGWLRNVEDERMQATWEYTSKLARRSEQIGYDLSLIAELNMNDIKGIDAPSLDAWSTSAALAAVTKKLELMVAVRPTFHLPALFAKQAANIDHISGGRLALNVVSSWWEQEAKMYGVDFGVARCRQWHMDAEEFHPRRKVLPHREYRARAEAAALAPAADLRGR